MATHYTSTHLSPPRATVLVRGEFAPVYWEPLGKRAERLVAGFLLALDDRPAFAHITLQHRRLLDFISSGQADSAAGIIRFAFDFFNKTLAAGGIIEDLRPPFASMHIGRIERVSGTSDAHVMERALKLCTLLGQMPDQPLKADGGRAAAKTLAFLRDVRHTVAKVDRELARAGMRTRQMFDVGDAQFRTHFQYKGQFVQFCSLPLPNARLETATECNSRLAELAIIASTEANARVALCVNTKALEQATAHQGQSNTTVKVLARTRAFAESLRIPMEAYSEPEDAASFLRRVSGRAAPIG